MGAVWLRLRAESRQQWRTWLALTVLLGVIGGMALTAAAGARRTDTAYPRLLRRSHAADLLVSPALSGFHGYFRAVARLPGVSSLDSTMFLQMSLPVPGASPFSGMVAEGSPFGDEGTAIDRVKILAGRIFDPADPRAVMISPALADRARVGPGGTLHLIGYPQRGNSPDIAHAVRLAFRVSAIVEFVDEIVPANGEIAEPRVLLSPAFARTALAQSFNPAGGGGYVVLRPGAGAAAFTHQATALAGRYRVGNVQVVHLATEYGATQRAIRPEAAALAIFAALAGLIALVIIAQLLSRQLVLDSVEFPVLRALGMGRSRLAALALAGVAVVTTTGAVVAVGIAIAASPLMPIGPARAAEPSPGVEVNLAILGAGFVVIAVVPLLVMVPAALRAAARAPGALGLAEPTAPARRSRLGPALGLAGSVPGSIGVRMAFEPGHGRSAVPVRSALVGTTVAVAAVVAAMVFGASFLGLVGTPHRYGQNWDQQLDLQVGAVPATIGARVLTKIKGLTEYVGGNYGQVTVAAPGWQQRHGGAGDRPGPAARERVPHPARGPGPGRARRDRPRPPHPPHTGPAPRAAGRGHRERQQVPDADRGLGGLRGVRRGRRQRHRPGDRRRGPRLGAVPARPGLQPGETCYNFFLLRYRPGTDLRAAAAQVLRAATRTGCPMGLCLVTTEQRPSDIQDYTGVRDTPLVLGAVLALLAVGTLAHVLLTGVQRRRRDLAVLRTLGLLRSQLLRVVSWQASALAGAALLVGLPLGLLAGRWAWLLFAGSAGVGSEADIPVALVLLAIPVTLILANVIAAGPGWSAGRIRPALILRSE